MMYISHVCFGHTRACNKVTRYLTFVLVLSDSTYFLSVYFGVLFPILVNTRTIIVQHCQINVKMRTCNLTNIAKSVIFETFFGLEENK